MRLIPTSYKTALFAGLFFLANNTQANSIACFNTNMGQFCIELFETQTPITTANFFDYIKSAAYTNGIFHRSMPKFVIQGGGFKIVEGTDGKKLSPVNTFTPIANEFKLSNTRGTVAMAKLSGNPNSATSQWFVNLADNSLNLDNQNGGFTVFGRVIFDGMKVIDVIGKLPIANLGGSLTATPTIGTSGSSISTDNLVQITQVEVIDTTGVFSESALTFAVDIGTGEALAVKLLLIEDKPAYVFKLDPASVASLPSNPVNIATFSSGNGQLHIPSVMINASTVVKNVKMQLTDANSFKFTLLSYE
ncbi:peptidylprolyl isomerase [Nitrosomonas sp.]|uniref:peptidylprolyl isomerase n=1 Tax=Nitrosomonas sp. TaxID=42353 RepID=UPI00374CCF14